MKEADMLYEIIQQQAEEISRMRCTIIKLTERVGVALSRNEIKNLKERIVELEYAVFKREKTVSHIVDPFENETGCFNENKSIDI